MQSCNRTETSTAEDKEELTPGTPPYFFAKAKEAKESREKMHFLNKAYCSVEDKQEGILLDLLDFKIYYHNKLKEYDSSLHYSNKYIELAKLQQDSSELARAYYRKSMAHRGLNNHLEFYHNAFEARKLYQVLQDTARVGRLSFDMGSARGKMGDLSGRQRLASEALRYLDREKDSALLQHSYNAIAMTYESQQLFPDALQEYQNALDYSTTPAEANVIKNNIALVHKDLGNYNTAISIWQELLKSEQNSPTTTARIIDNLAYTKWLQKPSLDVSADLKKALQMRQDLNDLDGIRASYSHLAEFYAERDNTVAAAYARTHLDAAIQYGSATSKLEALENIIKISSPAQTEEYAREYVRLSDSLRIARLRVQNVFAKIQYDEEQKIQEIQQLQTISARQKLAIAQERQRKIIYISGIVVLLLGSSLLIMYLRQRHKRERLKEVYRTETRISKKVHDELANDVYTVMTQLAPTTEPEVINKIANIYKRTRDISRENSSIKTGEGFRQELLAMLGSYIPSSTRLFNRGLENVQWTKISAEKQVVVYRVLQELMTNMKKHSGAKLVALNFETSSKNLKINYSDNGKGVASQDLNFRNGLQNVENRIFSIDGTFTFDSAEGQGFKAEIEIPL